MLRRERWHVVSWRRWPILVVMLLVLNRRQLRTIRFGVLIAIIILITCRWIRRLKQLIERGCRSGWLWYTLTGHGISLLGKHCTRWPWHTHHWFGISVPELAKTVGLRSITIGVVLLFRRRWMMNKVVAKASRGRRRVAILVRRRLFKIIGFRHVTITDLLITVLRSAVRRSAAVTAAHVFVIVVIDRQLLLLLFTFGRFGRHAAHGRPSVVAAVLETGNVQRPAVLVATVYVAARLVFRVRCSHVVRRRYWQQNVCQHPAAATRQRQRTY